MNVYAQDPEEKPSIEKLQGVWKFQFTRKGESKTFEAYRIIKQNKLLEIFNDTSYKEIRTRLAYIGFWDNNEYPKNINKFNKNGHILYYIDIPNNIDTLVNITNIRRSNWLTFNENGKLEQDYFFSYGLSSIPDEYIRINALPLTIVLRIKQNIDLWKEYKKLINLKKIMHKSTIYLSPSIPTKRYLLKNDLVEILEEKSQWIRIRYYGTRLIEGWAKVMDIEK
ncbi:hypothetical protein [Larkinella rosea]|uniref:SH3 domain-containing protein n=1 Tax=Larkinella rosea TaxID=2025312 RepID=A0A3P1BP45_9BACT|nr:hypothetical protein [Larkinella rosea]RRB02831.1 hypothetical protein EHT25_20550 [Larkinella rosea]